MNILEILQLIAVLVPGLTNLVETIIKAVRATPGTVEHTEAITAKVIDSKNIIGQ